MTVRTTILRFYVALYRCCNAEHTLGFYNRNFSRQHFAVAFKTLLQTPLPEELQFRSSNGNQSKLHSQHGIWLQDHTYDSWRTS